MSFAAHSVPREPDLFGDEDQAVAADRIAAAKLRLRAAQAAQAEALRRHRCAPHGEVGARLRALQAAVHEALRAASELAAAIREASH